MSGASGEARGRKNGGPTTVDDYRFWERSMLFYMIPVQSELRLDVDLVQTASVESLFQGLEQRQLLFFDETVTVLLALKTPWVEEEALKMRLRRVHITVEVTMTNGRSVDGTSPPTDEVLYSGHVDHSNEPFIVLDDGENGKAKDSPCACAAWSVAVPLTRPAIRLRHPYVLIKAWAVFQTDTDRTGRLPSGMPSSINVLEAFAKDFGTATVKPRLSAARLSHVMAATQTRPASMAIPSLPHLRLDIFPALQTRIRLSRVNSSSSLPDVIAVVEVDFTPYADCEVVLSSVALHISGGSVEDLNRIAGIRLPLVCVPHDHVTLLYKICPEENDRALRHPPRELAVTIMATVQLGPNISTPKLTVEWTAPLDFTVPARLGFGPAMQPIERLERPTSRLPSQVGQGEWSAMSPSGFRPDSIPSLDGGAVEERGSGAMMAELGITMSFTAQGGIIRTGQVFSWSVHVVNRATELGELSERTFSLVALPWRRRADVSITTSERPNLKADIANAVMDQTTVHGMIGQAAVDPTEVLCLSADVRVGPLAAGACQVVELKFLALGTGLLGMDAIRVVDLRSLKHVDIHELPLVAVQVCL